MICIWEQDDIIASDVFMSTCGQYFQFNTGGARENGFRFCPYCGRPLVETVSMELVEDTTGIPPGSVVQVLDGQYTSLREWVNDNELNFLSGLFALTLAVWLWLT